MYRLPGDLMVPGYIKTGGAPLGGLPDVITGGCRATLNTVSIVQSCPADGANSNDAPFNVKYMLKICFIGQSTTLITVNYLHQFEVNIIDLI